MALAVLGGLLQMRIGALGVKNDVRGFAFGSSESRAGRKDFRKWRPGDVGVGIVSQGPWWMVVVDCISALRGRAER